MPRIETPTLAARYHDLLLMADEWYIDTGGQVEGPVSVGELRDRAAAGTLAPTASVSADRVKWMPAGSLPNLTFPTVKQRQPLLETVVSGSIQPGENGGRVAGDTSVVPIVFIPGYSLLDTLGTGACGVVYKAKHQTLNRIVALKTVLMPDKASRDLIERFKQEAVSLARLQHPNIVTIYDSGVCETPKDQVYFAMELLDGEDLDKRVDRAGPLDEYTAWLVARQTAAALAHAAKLGVIHRDIKPANLFLVPPPTGFPLPPGVPMVKVTDFGLALSHGASTETDQRQTAAGVLLGTPVYMAPEQFDGSSVDQRADIYSLGATVYHILTGHPPFDGRTVWEVMRKKAVPAPRLPSPISPETADLVAAMMAVDAADRPANYVDLIARIDALPCLDGAFGGSCRIPVASAPVIALPPVPPMPAPIPPVLPTPTPAVASTPAPTSAPILTPLPQSRRRWLVGVAALVLLVGAGLGLAALAGAFNRPPAKKEEPAKTPATYIVSSQELLYRSGSIIGWVPAGGYWEIINDAEKSPVLSGTGGAIRPFDPPANFRVLLTLDPYKATTVDVVIATTGGGSPTKWLVRLDRQAGNVTFGKQAGAGGFEAVGNAVPLPTAEELASASKRPYLEVGYERTADTLSVWFLKPDQRLGNIPTAGLTTTEFRIQATGGAVRIDYAALETLVKQE